MDKGRAVVDTVMNFLFQRNAAHILCILGSVGFSRLLTQYCAGDKIENEMGWACGAYG